MKKTLLAIASIAVMAACNPAETKKEAVANPPINGKAFDTTKAVTVDEMAGMVLGGKEFMGNVSGTIEKVCQKAGCWADVKLANGEVVMIKFRDSVNNEFGIDKNSVGKKIIAHGIGFTDTVSIEQLKHYAKDDNKPEAEIEAIKAPKIAIGFTADGAVVK